LDEIEQHSIQISPQGSFQAADKVRISQDAKGDYPTVAPESRLTFLPDEVFRVRING